MFFILEIIYPRIPGIIPPQDFVNTAPAEDILSLYTNYLVSLCFWAAGLLALAGLIYGGILYLLSTGKPERMATAKSQISGAFFGLLILFSSYLILNTINPQLTSFRIPTLETFEIETQPDVPLPDLSGASSSIDVEIPVGRIIEKIFETYVSEYPRPENPWTPRMTRITDNITATTEITNRIKTQSENLKSGADSCRCGGIDPCAWADNPGPGCDSNTCAIKQGCTGDPCEGGSRSKIQQSEDENTTEINNLVSVQIETEQEVRLLKEQLERLKRAEKFIKECPRRSLKTWLQLTSKRDDFKNRGDILRDIKFWDDISIQYYTSQNLMLTDAATFYCAVSGTYEQEPSYYVPDITGDESVDESILSQEMACSNEAPLGEIIDRAKRTTQSLINDLEGVIEQDKNLIRLVDELQVLVNQCSSQNCYSIAVCIPCTKYCCSTRDGSSCCYCAKSCTGNPCPSGAISNKLEEIKITYQQIIYLKNRIDLIINQVAPEIINDLIKARYVMRHYDEMFNCIQAKGATIPPGGRTNIICCQTETLEGNQTAYGDCFEQCYLEIGQDSHRNCVQDCLNRGTSQPGNTTLPECINELNFYVCEQ